MTNEEQVNYHEAIQEMKRILRGEQIDSPIYIHRWSGKIRSQFTIDEHKEFEIATGRRYN